MKKVGFVLLSALLVYVFAPAAFGAAVASVTAAPAPTSLSNLPARPAPSIPVTRQDQVKPGGNVAITIKNNRSHKMYFAFCWSGYDYSEDERAGWYSVEAGQSRTVKIGNTYVAGTDGFGYYATGGGSTWEGDFRTVIIHQKKTFEGHPDDPMEGGEHVGFRKVTVKEDRTANLTFNP